MFEAWEKIIASGLPVVGLAGAYTLDGMETHIHVDPCHWFEVGADWYRVDVAQELDDLQLQTVAKILRGEDA